MYSLSLAPPNTGMIAMSSSLTTFLTDTELMLVASGVAFAAGVMLSQRVKDALKGVPSEVRTALDSAEAHTLTAVKQAQSEVLAKILPVAAPAVVAAAETPPS